MVGPTSKFLTTFKFEFFSSSVTEPAFIVIELERIKVGSAG